jgi:hypothetical protein
MSRRPREGLAAADAGLAINPNFVTLFVSHSLAELSPSATMSRRRPTLNWRCN